MVSGFKVRFTVLLAGILAISLLMSLAGSVVDAGGRQAGLQSGGGAGGGAGRPRALVTDPRYVHTPAHVFDPLQDPVLPVLAAFDTSPAFPSKRGGNYYILQSEGRFRDTAYQERVLRTGATIVQTMAGNTLVVRANPLQLERIATYPSTRWAGPYHPFYRVQPALLALLEGEREEDYLDSLGRVSLLARLFPGERASDYLADVRAMDGVWDVEALDDQPVAAGGTIQLRADLRRLPSVLHGLARLGGVRVIGGAPNVRPMNDRNRWVHQTYDNDTDLDVAARVHARGVTGLGQVIAVVDTGLENDNCHFRYSLQIEDVTYAQVLDPGGSGDLANVTNPCNKVIAYYLSDNAWPYDPRNPGSAQHGTHVAGTIAGDNFRTDTGGIGLSAWCEIDQEVGEPRMIDSGNPPSVHAGGEDGRYDGTAPAAQLVIQDRGMAPGTGLDLPITRVRELIQGYDSGARFQNHSYGSDNSVYDLVHSADIDDFLFARRTMNVVWSAGNTGDLPPPTLGGYGAVAKNTITVGEALDGSAGAAMDLNLSSGKGPTLDGRMKPDLAARGLNRAAQARVPEPADIAGGMPNGDLDCETEAALAGGTSFTAPVVTGLAALVAQYFEDGYYPTGNRTRGEYAVPGLRMTLDNGSPLQTDPVVNTFADKCSSDLTLCDPGTSFRPTNALVKAILVNATRNMTGENTAGQPGAADARPNNGQGWGVPILDDALYFEGDVGEPGGQRSGLLVLTDTPNGVRRDSPGDEFLDVREDVVFRFADAFSAADPLEIKEWQVTVLPGEPLVVTLAWMDPGQGTAISRVLMNDLDLEVIGPNPNDPSEEICWRPDPLVAYTGPAPDNFRDGWVQTSTMIDSGEARIWVGKDGSPVPIDKNDWPDPDSADRLDNVEQVAIRADEVVGGNYTIRVLNWDVSGSGVYVDGEPDFEVDGKGITGIGQDNVELDQQGFALVLTGNFATSQGVIRFNQASFDCTDGQMAVVTLRDENGCADPDPRVVVTTTTPWASFPSDHEVFPLVPEFPCEPGPPDGPDQPRVWTTAPFPVVNTSDPAGVVHGDGRASLAPGYQVVARFTDVDPAGGISTARASLRCSAAFVGDGWILSGGCDLENPFDVESRTNPRIPDQFMDADELVEYTAFFINTSSRDFDDVQATLSQVDDTDRRPELQVLNNPVQVGRVPAGRRASATFLVQMDTRFDDPVRSGAVEPREHITLQVALTSPGDDLFDPQTFVQEHEIEADILTYTYNTRDPWADQFGPDPGQIKELRPGRTADDGDEAWVRYHNMMVDPGDDGAYQTLPGPGQPLQGDDEWSLNFQNMPPEALDPWDWDDDADGWRTDSDFQYDGEASGWTWSSDGDGSTAGGCGWATNWETATAGYGNGIWHTGGVSQVQHLTTPPNLGPDPEYDDIYLAPNNQAPTVCETYKKFPENGQIAYFWYLKAPRLYRVNRSGEFQVAWQRWTIYTRLYGHVVSEATNRVTFVAMAHNKPLAPDYTFRDPEFFNSVYASTPAGPNRENPIAGDWTDDNQNTWTWNLSQPDRDFPDRSYEEYYGPPSTEGWEHALTWFMLYTEPGSPVPNRYGWGVSDSAFIWTESSETDDRTDCALADQRPTVFFNQLRYNLCEGEMALTVIDPNFTGQGYVYVRVTSDEEGLPGEVVRLRENPDNPARYEGRIFFTANPAKDIRGVLLVTSGFTDTGQGSDIVVLQYDPEEPQDPGPPLGVTDWLDEGYPQGNCSDGPDGENDDYRNNCTGDLMDAHSMTPTPDDDGDGCPDGDGIPDAEDDCDSLILSEDPACDAILQNCPAAGREVNDAAWVNCPSGGVFYVRHELIDATLGDGDRYADRNEDLYLSVDLLNLRANDLENATVRITTDDDTICILDGEAFYGDIPGVTTARLQGLDRLEQVASTPPTHPVTGEVNFFRIGVPSETITASLTDIRKATIRVDVYADNFSTAGTDFSAAAPMLVEMPLDLDPVSSGPRPDFLETFCNASGPSCFSPPGRPAQTWYTQAGFAADPDSGVVYVDSTQAWPDNGGFCPECDFHSPTGCSIDDFIPPATAPPCEYLFDGTGPAGDSRYIDDWHVESLGQTPSPPYGTAHSGQNALHFGDHDLLAYNKGQLSALVLPAIAISSDPACDPELRFWQMADFWFPTFTDGLQTPLGTAKVEINTDWANGFPETSWLRLDPYEEGYNTYTDALNACRGLFCGVHHPTIQSAGDWDGDPNGSGLTGRWVETAVVLDDFRGQMVKVRFLVSVLQDFNVASGNRGWILDDIFLSCVASGPGFDLEADPLAGPGPCGLRAGFTVQPASACLSGAVQFADTHVGLGLPDGSGGREPVAWEWDFDGDTTPEIACTDLCLGDEDVAGHVDPSVDAGTHPTIASVAGDCRSPLVAWKAAGNYTATMALCQAGSVQDTASGAVRVRPDLEGIVSVATTPMMAKGEPGCPATVPDDLDGDTVVDAADQAIWDAEFIGCVYSGTRVRFEALVPGGSRDLNYCWSNEGELICGERNGVNFHRFEHTGAYRDFVTVTDGEGGCSHTEPLGLYVVPGADPQISAIDIYDDSCGQTTLEAIDPGEYVRIVVQVENAGAGPAVEMVGELRTFDAGVRIHKAASRVIGPFDPWVLLGGETGTAEFTFLVSDLHACRGVLDFDLDLYTWDRTLDRTLNFTLPVGRSTAQSETCADADLEGSISRNAYVCDPGGGADVSGCPNPGGGPAPDCAPSLQEFATDTACSDGTITDLCVRARISMNGINNHADELNVALLGPHGQSFPLLLGNSGGDGCQDVTIDLCTGDNLGEERTVFCDGAGDEPPARDAAFYDDFRAALRNTDSGAQWRLRVEDAQRTSLQFEFGQYTQVQAFSVDLDITSPPVCSPVPLQDACLDDLYGPIFGGAMDASGCGQVTVQWLNAIDQEDGDGDRRADTVPMDYDVLRAEAASCDPADAPGPGAFARAGTVSDAGFLVDDTVDTGVGAYWYRVIATDGAGHPSDDPVYVLNPDDPAHWACTEMAALCPDPVWIGPVERAGADRLGAGVEITSGLAGLAGVRLYRGTFLPAPGGQISPANQDHQVVDGVAGNCFEPASVTSIRDDDSRALRYGGGSYYYLAVPLATGTPFIEGPIDSPGFPGNGQVLPRVPPGNHDCP